MGKSILVAMAPHPLGDHDDSLFSWLARFHVEDNVVPYLSRMVEQGGQPVPEGMENDDVKGFMVLADGEVIRERLMADNIALGLTNPVFYQARTYDQFADNLRRMVHRDGAIFYDGTNREMARIPILSNSPPNVASIVRQLPTIIPHDYTTHGRTGALSDHDLDDLIGTKMFIAAVLPIAYSTPDHMVRGYHLRRTAYADAGLGKLARFGPGHGGLARGVDRELYFRSHNSGEGPLVHPFMPVVALERHYPDDGPRIEVVRDVREICRYGQLRQAA